MRPCPRADRCCSAALSPARRSCSCTAWARAPAMDTGGARPRAHPSRGAVELPGHGIADMPVSLTLAGAGGMASIARFASQVASRSCSWALGGGPGRDGGSAALARTRARARARRDPRCVRRWTPVIPRRLLAALAPTTAARCTRALPLSGATRAGRGALCQRGGARLDGDDDVDPASRSAPISRTCCPRCACRASGALERSWADGESWRACADTLGYAGAHDVTPSARAGRGHFVMLDRPALLAEPDPPLRARREPAVVARAGSSAASRQAANTAGERAPPRVYIAVRDGASSGAPVALEPLPWRLAALPCARAAARGRALHVDRARRLGSPVASPLCATCSGDFPRSRRSRGRCRRCVRCRVHRART